MRRFQSILYAARGTTDESDALKQALSAARSNEAALNAVVICPSLPGDFGEYKASYEALLADRVSASIASARAALGMSQNETRTTVEVECGDTPAVRIVRRVLRNACDLLVKQAEPADRDKGFRALDMQLLRLCPCPVLLCRPTGRESKDIRVAVAVDPQSTEAAGRDLALQLLRLGDALTDTYSADLDIVSCWDFAVEADLRHSPWARVSEEFINAGVTKAEGDHLAALERLIDESGVARPFHVHRIRGRPEQAIPGLVDELQVDIVVMGTVARTGVSGFVIGNTAENVLGEIRCSLLAVKPNGFVSPVRAYG